MKNVLAITMAIMIAAIVMMPAFGYTGETAVDQSFSVTAAGNQSYTENSTENISNNISSVAGPSDTISAEVAANNLTKDEVVSVNSLSTSQVKNMRVPYSIKYGYISNYSIRQDLSFHIP